MMKFGMKNICLALDLCLAQLACSYHAAAQEGHYSGPMNVNAHSRRRVNDGRGTLQSSPHMGRDEYDRWLRQGNPNIQDLPLRKRLRLEWEATGGWDNPRNYR